MKIHQNSFKSVVKKVFNRTLSRVKRLPSIAISVIAKQKSPTDSEEVAWEILYDTFAIFFSSLFGGSMVNLSERLL